MKFDQVHLLKELYGRLILPRAVYEEMQRRGRPKRFGRGRVSSLSGRRCARPLRRIRR
jgi:predicted nucleic acid-binding protein